MHALLLTSVLHILLMRDLHVTMNLIDVEMFVSGSLQLSLLLTVLKLI